MSYRKKTHLIKTHFYRQNFFTFSRCIYTYPSWWFQPIWKILAKLDHFPKVRDEHKKYWKPLPSTIVYGDLFPTPKNSLGMQFYPPSKVPQPCRLNLRWPGRRVTLPETIFPASEITWKWMVGRWQFLFGTAYVVFFYRGVYWLYFLLTK